MKKIFIYTIAFLFSTNAISQVEGDVSGEQGRSLPNVLISATDTTGKIIDTTRTDKRGFYSFRTLKPGNYLITVRLRGYKTFTSQIITVNEGDALLREEDLYAGQRLDIAVTAGKSQ